MAFPCFLLPACHVTSLHPHIPASNPTLAKPKQPQGLAHEASLFWVVAKFEAWRMGEIICVRGAQERDSLWFLWQPKFT